VKVLFVVSECVPYIKSGGLADVAGSLPKELKRLGTDVRVILPKYGMIPTHFRERMRKIAEYTVSVGWRQQYCGIECFEHDGVIFYFIDNEYYFKRDKMYGFYDDGERFSFFCRAVLESLPHLSFYPDIIHCHDWHTGMIPFLLRVDYQFREGYQRIRTIFTIHNLQFQGIFPREVIWELLNLDRKYDHPEYLEFYGNMNFMKGALVSSDYITTVSPTYCQEIQTPYYGEKLDGLLRWRKDSLIGILNGIDDQFYNPLFGPYIWQHYSPHQLDGKVKNKEELQRKFGLEVNRHKPIIAMISRLTKQKGLDLVTHLFDELLQEDIQLIILGTGDWEFEQFFQQKASQYSDKVRVSIGFNEPLAHQIYAGSDLFLMPSKFEPCGLGQLIALKYGTIPIVRETGGLNDTVIAYRDDTGEGNGFSFTNYNAHDMLYTIRRALQYYKRKEVWEVLVKRAMEQDYSWAQSAFKYSQLYADITSRRESHVF
jgi:starch synthase